MSDEPVVEIELNPRERRLYDRLRARLSEPQQRGRSGVRDLVLLLPDLTVLLVRLLRDDRVPLRAKATALLALGYVLSPVDILPEALLGPAGFADDLLVVGAALSRLLNYVHPDIVRSHWSGRGDALEAIHRISSWAEGQVKDPLRTALRRARRLLSRG